MLNWLWSDCFNDSTRFLCYVVLHCSMRLAVFIWSVDMIEIRKNCVGIANRKTQLLILLSKLLFLFPYNVNTYYEAMCDKCVSFALWFSSFVSIAEFSIIFDRLRHLFQFTRWPYSSYFPEVQLMNSNPDYMCPLLVWHFYGVIGP